MGNNGIPLCDIHSHILPGIDDGCTTVEESLEQLHRSREQNVERIFLTPHYYHRAPVSDFVAKRAQAWQKLCDAIGDHMAEYPQMKLGAEVAYYRGISFEENLDELCLGNGRFLLLELPFAPWSESMLQELDALRSVCGREIVIAHLERYSKYQNRRTMEALMDRDVLIQMNAEFILSRRTRHKASKMIEHKLVDLLGSDCHNLDSRVQNLGEACRELYKAKLDGRVEEIMSAAGRIFDGGKIL